MKEVYKFYVIDSLTETVVGSFFALNKDVAYKVLDSSFKSNDKLQQIGDYLRLMYDEVSYTELETYSEVVDTCVNANWHIPEISKNG